MRANEINDRPIAAHKPIPRSKRRNAFRCGPRLARFVDEEEIGIVRLHTGRREHGVDLAAMMGLVIEEMDQCEGARLAHLATGSAQVLFSSQGRAS